MDNNTLRAAKQSRELRANHVLLERTLAENALLHARIAFLEEHLGVRYEAPEPVVAEANPAAKVAKKAEEAMSSDSSEQEEADASSNPDTGSTDEVALPEDLDELRAICTEHGIKFHPNAKATTLQEKIRFYFLEQEEAE